MYNYCVILKCKAEGKEANGELASACDGDATCSQRLRRDMLSEFKAIEGSIRGMYNCGIRLSPYDYRGEHPTEFAKGDYAFIAADLLLEENIENMENIGRLVDSILLGVVTYIGSLLVSKVEVSALRIIHRRECFGYRLYEDKSADGGFRKEEFRPKKRKGGCRVC